MKRLCRHPLTQIAQRLLNPDTVPLTSKMDFFLRDRTQVFVQENRKFIVLIGRSMRGGADKQIWRGWLPTDDRVHRVAVLASRLKGNSEIRVRINQREIDHHKAMMQGRISGSVETLLLRETAPEKEGQPISFTALLALYGVDNLPDLFSNLKTVRTMELPQKRNTMRSLIESMLSIHRKKIVHRDIKSENLLVKPNKDGSMRVKLCDFAFASNPGEDPKLNANLGTVLYFAPELVRAFCLSKVSYSDEVVCFDYSVKSDVWAAAILLLYLERTDIFNQLFKMHLLRPTDPIEKDEFNFKIIRNLYQEQYDGSLSPSPFFESTFPEPKDSQSMEHVIWEAMNPNPAKRLDSEGLLQKFKAACEYEKDTPPATYDHLRNLFAEN